MKKILLLIILSLILTRMNATNYYWVGGIGSSVSPKLWNSGSNWSASSGGAAASAVPGSGDIAIFDASTNNGSPFVDISGLTISLTGLQVTPPASGATTNNVVSFVGNSTNFTISGDLTINSVKPASTQYNGQISDYGNNTFTVQGNVNSNSVATGIVTLVTLPSTATYSSTAARVALTGSTSSIIDTGTSPASNLGFINLDISGTTTTTFSTTNALTILGNLNIQAGGKLSISKTLQLNSSSSPFRPSTVSGNGVIAFSSTSNIFIGGTLPDTYTSSNVQDMGTLNFDTSVASTVSALNFQRPFASIKIGTCQNNTLTANGNLSFNNGFLDDGGNSILLGGHIYVTTQSAAGTHTGTGGITMTGTSKTIAPNGTGVTAGSVSLQNLTLNNAVTMSMPTTINGTLVLKNALTTNSYLTMANGSTINVAAATGTLSAAPTLGTATTDRVNVTISAGTVSSGNEIAGTTPGAYGLLTVSGTAAYTYNPTSNIALYTGLTIASSATTALTVSAGKTLIFANGSAITHTGTGAISYTSGNGGFQYGLAAGSGGTSSDRVNIVVSNNNGSVSIKNPEGSGYSQGVTGAGLGSLTVNGNGGTCAIVNSAPTLWGGLSIGTGSTLNLGSANLYLNGGNWSNAGTFTAGTGNVQFNSNGQSISNTSGSENFYNLTIHKNGTTTANCNITVSNALTINSGGTGALNINANKILTLDGSMSNGGTLTVNGTLQQNTTGALTIGTLTYNSGSTLNYNSTSNAESLWPSTGGPTNVNIMQGGLTLTSAKTIPNISIGSGSSLTVNAGNQLTVSSSMTNNGTLNLNSDVNGTATILSPVTISGTGTVNAQQYLGMARNWYVSSPVTNATSPANNIRRYYEYVEAGDNADLVVAGSTAYWKGLSTGHSMAIGKGYIAQASAETTVQFSGTPNNGNITTSFNLTRDDAKGKGFNLVGNPYPSYIDWSLVAQVNTNLMSTAWFKTKKTDVAGGGYTFASVNVTTPSSPEIVANNANSTITKYIPPTQAFWVRVKSGTASTSMSFTNAMREHRLDNGDLMKAPKVNERSRLRLQLVNGIESDETLIYFDKIATNDFNEYDSPKMMNNSAVTPDLYTKAGVERLVINGMNAIVDNMELPLGFSLNTAASLKLKATEMSNFPVGTRIYLLDKVELSQVELLPEKEYSFNTTASTTNNESRFSILFRAPGASTGISNAEKRITEVFVNAANQITIIAPEKASYCIYNAVGQKVTEGITTANCTIANGINNSGIYVVKVSENGKNYSTRVILNGK